MQGSLLVTYVYMEVIRDCCVLSCGFNKVFLSGYNSLVALPSHHIDYDTHND